MKKYSLLVLPTLFLMLSFIGCETGTRYDKNDTKKIAPKHEAPSGVVNRSDIRDLVKDIELEEEVVEHRSWIEIEESQPQEIIEEENSFSSEVLKNSLDVVKIREGRHEGYLRLVFDVYEHGQASKTVGQYEAKYSRNHSDISVILHGYQKFSAPLPSFPHDSTIEQIYFEQYPTNQGFKFHIKLREDAKVKIFDLKNPARLVFDIKAI